MLTITQEVALHKISGTGLSNYDGIVESAAKKMKMTSSKS